VLPNLPVIRSSGARLLFLGSAIITVAILLLAHHLSRSGAAAGLTTIFSYLFAIGDFAGSKCALLILLAAAFVPGRYSGRPLLQWVGQHPGWVAAASVVVLSCGAWAVYRVSPLCMDEYAALFQSEVFAAGHLTGQFPTALLDWLLPRGFQDFFLNVSHVRGRIASAYWPSFALLLTPFTWLGIPWICNPLLSSLTILAVHRLALRIFADHESAGLAVLLTAASPVFFANGISYYSMPAHLLASTLYALLLIDPTPRRALAAGVVGSVALTLSNPFPHMLFAAPWIIWILRRPGGLPVAGWLFAGYLPLCLLLGLGWFWFSTELTHEGVNLAMGTSASGDTLVQMGSAFAPPSPTLLLARLIGIAKVWVWAVPGLLLLAGAGGWKWRHNTACHLLIASALLTLAAFLFVPVDQGHGWGFRYFHSAWIALPILAAGALARVPATGREVTSNPGDRRTRIFEDPGTRTFVVAVALVTLIGGTAFRAVQMRDFIGEHWSQVPAYSGTERRVVILDPKFAFYGLDLVQNDPWLRGNVIRMITHGPVDDAQMMREHFPDLHQVYSDRFGSVWSAGI
jgi:hypothetical protein